MAVAETIMLKIGSSIAKAVVKLWLNDEKILQAGAISVMDLLTGKTSDFFQQQAAAKRFERMGQEVAQSLRPLFERENLPENELEAVGYAVADTIDKAGITPGLLAAHDLDRKRFEAHLLSAQPGYLNQLDPAAQELYKRIMAGCAGQIVKIASKLPGYDEQTMAAILQRETLLIDLVKRVREEEADHFAALKADTEQILTNQQQVQREADTKRAAIRKTYLTHVFDEVRDLSLAGIDPKAVGSESEALKLDQVYTALLTITPERHDFEHLMRGQMPDREMRYLSALYQLNRHPKLVLLGDPGSGKSTFVNFVTLCMIGDIIGHEQINIDNLLTAPLPDKNGNDQKDENDKIIRQKWEHKALLPVRVILRDFAARILLKDNGDPCAQSLIDFVNQELERAGLRAFQEHLWSELHDTGGLILLDGLDEIPQADDCRSGLKKVVEDFARTFKKCRILVTSRTYAYQTDGWKLHDFAEAVLTDFTQGQIIRFVQHWYDHIAVLRHLNRDDARGRAAVLQQAILGNRSLYDLAVRPLLLTLMASLHAWRGGSLPENREELYNDTVDLLLDWWESPKKIYDEQGKLQIQPSVSELMQVGRDKLRKLLNRLAYEVHSRQKETTGTADIPEDDLIVGLVKLNPGQPINTDELIRFLNHRAGILLPRGTGVYTFPHRTFQEYLAACYLTNYNYPRHVTELVLADPNRWREATLLAGAKAGRGSSAALWNLVESLTTLEPGVGWGSHLAGQLLAEAADLSDVDPWDRPKLDKVRHNLTQLIRADDAFAATERAIAGQHLAKLNDPREEVLTIEKFELCYVPGGPFVMGEGDEEHENDCLDYDYWISRFPVTNAQFAEFVQAEGYCHERHRNFWPEAIALDYWTPEGFKGRWDSERRTGPYRYRTPFDLPNHPVVGVTWYEALAFCRWLTEKWQAFLPENYHIMLPSEAEWEKAARGGKDILKEAVIVPAPGMTFLQEMSYLKNPDPKRAYPWPGEADTNCANYDETGIGTSSAVGCFPGGRSVYGCEEMSGNVLEWMRNVRTRYPYQPNDGREKLESTEDDWRALRGYGYWADKGAVRCASRHNGSPYNWDDSYGFRFCVCPAH